jgi:toxin-antitoxin system PIN domain toxin
MRTTLKIDDDILEIAKDMAYVRQISVGEALSALLDVNVLLAMLWPTHRSFRPASEWFARHHRGGWATCPMSQAGFVRIYSQKIITGLDISPREAVHVLEQNCVAARSHVFWTHEVSVFDILPEIRTRLVGHKQLTDAILLDLAIRNRGRLVTLDQRVRNLLPAASPRQSAIEVIPTA